MEYTFVRYLDLTYPLDCVDDVLRCICLRSVPDDGSDHSRDVGLRESARIDASEWYDFLLFSSSVSIYHTVSCSHFVPSFPVCYHFRFLVLCVLVSRWLKTLCFLLCRENNLWVFKRQQRFADTAVNKKN